MALILSNQTCFTNRIQSDEVVAMMFAYVRPSLWPCGTILVRGNRSGYKGVRRRVVPRFCFPSSINPNRKPYLSMPVTAEVSLRHNIVIASLTVVFVFVTRN